MDKVQKFGIISLITFGIVISLALALYTNCVFNSNSCSDSNQLYLSHFLHISLISAGLIGSIYAYMLMKSFDKSEINIENNIEILINDDNSNNKIIVENTDKK